MNTNMNIGQAAKAAGVSTKMIRHYELIRLLPQAGRSDAGYRLYGQRDVSVLRFIRQSRSLGFSMPQIADLEEKLREISEMKKSLEKLVKACHSDDQPGCAILDTLAIDSPAQPFHAARVVKLPRRNGRAAHEDQTSKPAASSSHPDLMAWMRGVYAHQTSAAN